MFTHSCIYAFNSQRESLYRYIPLKYMAVYGRHRKVVNSCFESEIRITKLKIII